MKIITGFVSNSSSTAFVIRAGRITKQQRDSIEELSRFINVEFTDEKNYGGTAIVALHYDRNSWNANKKYQDISAALQRLGVEYAIDEW